ncbi:hypothetical protein ACFWC9_31560 [Streptomyces goshikiensis]|uniref:hypothetical protein n=1 Tax=Streptomyces goshikiensis TaxID=1942 RepID=UPI0036A60682
MAYFQVLGFAPVVRSFASRDRTRISAIASMATEDNVASGFAPAFNTSASRARCLTCASFLRNLSSSALC